MKIIERYILKNFLPSFIWCLTIFLFLYVIIDLFANLDEVIREHIPFGTLVYYYLTFFPLIFVQTSPIAILLATIYNLSNLNKNNEIVAIKASGINIWGLIRPILITGILISIMVFIVNDKIVPRSANISAQMRETLIDKKAPAETKILDNVAIYGRKNRIIYARQFDTQKNELSDLVIHEHDKDQNLILKISAQKAKFVYGKWYIYNALISQVNNQGQFTNEPKFYKKTLLDMEERPSDFLKREWRPEFMSYRELKRYIKLFKMGSTKSLNRLKVDLCYRISFPFINFIIILIGAPFALHIRRGGALTGIGISIIIALFYYAFSAITLAFGKAGMLPPIVAAWLGNIVFGVYGFIKMQKLR